MRTPGTHGEAAPLDGHCKALDDFSRKWDRKADVFRERAAPPWWAPGLVVDSQVRASYEAYLPVEEYLRDLGRVARAVLPHHSWVPRVLKPNACSCVHADARPPSLPDLWAELPPHLAGSVTLRPGTLFALLCALASPPRFGTGFGRYPEQVRRLRETAQSLADRDLRILDLGCGTGQGTAELAAACETATHGQVRALGITLEPLEAWMATRHTLPHDPGRSEEFQAFRAADSVAFAAADVLAVPARGRFDIVLANGIVGGPFLNTRRDLGLFLGEVDRLLAPAGVASFASRFHAGRDRGVRGAMALASELGWAVRGGPRLVFLSRSGVNHPTISSWVGEVNDRRDEEAPGAEAGRR